MNRKIEEWQNLVRNAYSKHTRAGEVARIKYDAQLRVRATTLSTSTMPDTPNGELGKQSALAEFYKIFQTVENVTGTLPTKTEDLADTIELCVGRMRGAGHNPRIALLAQDDINWIRETRPDTIRGNLMYVGGTCLRMLVQEPATPNGLILDPDCVEVTYKTKDKARRLQLEGWLDRPKLGLTMVASIDMSVDILCGGGGIKLGRGA